MNRFRLLLLSNYFHTVSFGILSPLYALFVLEIGGSGFDAGASWALYALVTGSAMLMFGRYADRYPQQRTVMVIGGFLVQATAAGCYLLVGQLWQLYAVQTAFGFGVAMWMPAMKLIYSAAEDAGKEGEEWALLDGGNYIILSLASFLGGYLFSIFGFRIIFTLMAATQLAAAAVSYRSLLRPPANKPRSAAKAG